MEKLTDTKERQKYQIINDGFSSLLSSLKHLGVKSSKKVSKTNFWQMLIDQFSALSEAFSQIKLPEPIEGKPGHTPTDEELTVLIKKNMPEVIQGHTPTTEELLAIIKPLIPKVKNGETPSDERLISLIQPLIPIIDTSKIVEEASKLAVEEVKPLIPQIDTPEEQADKLSRVKKEWVPIEAIKGDFNSRVKPMVVAAGESKLEVTENNGEKLYAKKLNFVGDGVTVTNNGDNNLDISIQTSDPSLFVPYSGAISEVDINFQKIKNLADPTDDQDAATKKYVDDKSSVANETDPVFTAWKNNDPKISEFQNDLSYILGNGVNKITVSSIAPSNPQIGDLWIET